VLNGKKVNGAGSGFFDYRFVLPSEVTEKNASSLYFLAELSAKELFVKDQETYEADQDFMKGSLVAPSSNPNSYPMTDETLFPSEIKILVNGEVLGSETLPDDPADHRGVLSWHYQPRDGKLREAGSYGYLVKVTLPEDVVLKALRGNRSITVRLTTENGGGIAVYGRQFGRFALDPGLIYKK
jgi:predicted transcriptional regulator